MFISRHLKLSVLPQISLSAFRFRLSLRSQNALCVFVLLTSKVKWLSLLSASASVNKYMLLLMLASAFGILQPLHLRLIRLSTSMNSTPNKVIFDWILSRNVAYSSTFTSFGDSRPKLFAAFVSLPPNAVDSRPLSTSGLFSRRNERKAVRHRPLSDNDEEDDDLALAAAADGDDAGDNSTVAVAADDVSRASYKRKILWKIICVHLNNLHSQRPWTRLAPNHQ